MKDARAIMTGSIGLLVLMRQSADDQDALRLVDRLAALGHDAQVLRGFDRIMVGVTGSRAAQVDPREIEIWPGVSEVLRLAKPYELASRSHRQEDTLVRVGDVVFGGSQVVLIAGPCGVESEEQIHSVAGKVAAAGARVLRGGAFKPRSSPYSFQGLGEEALRYLRDAADANGLQAVSEVMDASQIDMVAEHMDILQVGARNMQNFALLKALGRLRKPVLLKRGISATIEEWLMSAEYLLAGGNGEVILCERGIRTFENQARHTFDVSAFPIVERLSHLPVIGDPSHAAGVRDRVAPLARAAVAAGADGLIIEVHPRPEEALSDGAQALLPDEFATLVQQLRQIAPALGRSID